MFLQIDFENINPQWASCVGLLFLVMATVKMLSFPEVFLELMCHGHLDFSLEVPISSVR